MEEEDDRSGSLDLDRPPSEASIPRAKVFHPFSPAVLALLMPASIFGVLARLGLVALFTYDGSSVFPLIWAQATGCFIMGFAAAAKEPIGLFYGPLYTAITTGFCGSLTTFSTWQFDVFASWINRGDYTRTGLQDFLNGLSITIITLLASIFSIKFGEATSKVVAPYIRRPPSPGAFVRHSASVVAVCIYAAAFPAYFRLPASFRHQVTAALLFSFPGTLTRYVLAIYLNKNIKYIPKGTLAANLLGTALIGTFHVLQNKNNSPLDANSCTILQGLIDGYCGCLTTVSTFAAELFTLKPKNAWIYGITSWILGQALLLLILGPSIWEGHVPKEISCTFD